MTMYASSSMTGRRTKFTPQAIEKIKVFVAEGISRDEIASRLGVTLASLQVTCSRLGISLRRTNGSLRRTNGSPHTADVGGRIPARGSVGIAHTREQKEVSQPAARAAPLAKFEIVMRYRGKEKASDIPLPLPALGPLALEATSRDLGVAELIGQVLVATINKDMIHNILGD